MTEYEADSIIEFWGGVDSCKNLIRSYNNITDNSKMELVERDYKISLIVKALEFKNEQI